MKPIKTAVFCLPFILAACDQGPEFTPDYLMAVDQAFSDYSKDFGYYDAFAKYLAPDAVALNSGQQPLIGRDAILETMEGGEGQLLWKPVGADIARSGDLGYTWGRYTFSFQDDEGQTQVSHGKYMTVWKRQPDGTFKAVLDGGNTNPAPESLSE